MNQLDVIRHTLWKRGDLRFLCHLTQKDMYDFFYSNNNRLQVWNCSRQLGKSTALAILGLAECIKKPKQIVIFAAPTANQAMEILKQKLTFLLETCPNEIKPKINKSSGEVEFHNGSRFIVKGVDSDEGRRIRGNTANLILLDEAAFMGDLDKLYHDIFSPMTRRTKGRIIISSTPPHSMAHAFPDFVARAENQGGYIKKTIMESGLPLSEIKEAIREHSIFAPDGTIEKFGSQRPSFKIEYMCELITDSEKLIIPEWPVVKKYAHKEKIERPARYQPYVGADWGMKDQDAIIFGYLDFKRQKLVIEDEILENNKTSTEIGKLIKEKIDELYPSYINHNSPEAKYSSIKFFADNELRLIKEVHQQTGILFIPATKHNRDASINMLRTSFSRNKIEISAKCEHLIQQLDEGIWQFNKAGERTDFIRNERLGHCDALSAFRYLHRMVDWEENPYEFENHSNQDVFVPVTNEPDNWGSLGGK